MAKFLGDTDLYKGIETLIEEAQFQLILISPYIHLHDKLISILKDKKELVDFQLIVVFGKNPENPNISLSKSDFEFFKQFKNIDIRYEKRLHAKYYANETHAILTSMNLLTSSINNNIEVGVLTKAQRLKNIAKRLWDGEDNLDKATWNFFEKVRDRSEIIYQKTTKLEKGILKKNKAEIVKIEKDETERFFRNEYTINVDNSVSLGFCIRTGVSIPFDISRPLSKEAFNDWNKFRRKDFKEKFCHFSGELSNGQTSFEKPILAKNWSKAKAKFGLK